MVGAKMGSLRAGVLWATALLIALPSLAQKRVCSAVPPCTHTTIQEAIDDASNSETILVEPGTYVENLKANTRSYLTLRSTTPWDPSGVVIDGNGAGPVLETPTAWTLEGLTIRNGSAEYGAGVDANQSLVVRNCVFEDNDATRAGAGIRLIGSRLTVTGSIFRNNTVVNPSTSGSGGGFSSGSATVYVYDSRFENNHVSGNLGAGGGAIAHVNGPLTILGSVFTGNTSADRGGALYADSQDVLVGGSLFDGNQAASSAGMLRGGGLYLPKGGDLIGVTVTGNSASHSGGALAYGGGLWISGPTRLSGGTAVTGNLATDDGGGLFCETVADGASLSVAADVSANLPNDFGSCGFQCTPGEQGACDADFVGVCAVGSRTCTANGLWGSCVSTLVPGQIEEDGVLCSDAQDNDCDGEIDLEDDSCVPPESVADTPNGGSTNDPVSTATGELYDTPRPDLDLGGPLPLFFRRHYASGLAAAGVAGRMGANWRHNFEWSLVDGGSTVEIVTWEGRRLRFDRVGSAWVLANGIEVEYQLDEPVNGFFYLGDPRTGTIHRFTNQRLDQVLDGRSMRLLLSYSGAELDQVTDQLGRTLSFTYDGSGHVETVSDGTRTVTFAYTGADLTGVTDVRGKTTTYAYDPGGLLTSTTRPRGNVPFAQTWDGDSRVATQTDSDGHVHSFAYSGAETTVTDPLSNTRVHTHSTRGDLLAVEDEMGDVYELEYDENDRRRAVLDRLGGETRVVYQPESGLVSSLAHADGTYTTYAYTPRFVAGILFWNVSRVDHPDGTFETFQWTNTGQLTRWVDRAGFEWLWERDDRGLPLRAINPEGGETVYTYFADGTLETMTDDSGNTTRYAYDALRRVIATEHADLTTRTYTWNDADQLLTATDERSNTTTFTYDDNGNLAAIENALGEVTTLTYDGNDRLLGVEDGLGHVASQTWDALGRVATRTDRSGRTTAYGYDARGRLASVTDPASEVWTFGFDDEGIPTSISDPLSHTTVFGSDPLGRLTSATSPLSNVVGVTFDAMGRVTARTNAAGEVTGIAYDARGLVAGIDEEGLTLGFTRDALGSVTALTDGNGEEWLRGRDAQGRVISRTDPLSRVETTTYDDRSRPDVVSFPGGLGTLTHTYDDAGNVTELDHQPSGPTLTYTYDALSRLIGADGVSFDYDAAGRLIESNGLVMTWDDAGRLESIDYDPDPVGEKLVEYAYDARGLLQSVTDWVSGTTTFGHDDAGRMVTMSRPNGVTTTWTWDDDDRLMGIAEDGASPISSIVLVRDAAGRTTKATRSVPLLASAASVAAAGFSHDAASQIDSAGYVYDAMGRSTADPTRTYTWDLASRLSSVDDGSVVNFGYDALGMRVSRTDASGTRTFVWNYGLGLPSVDVEQNDGSDLRYYVHTPDGALLYSLEAVGAARRDYHFDEMGNTLFLTDGAGAVVASYSYGPYGEELGKSGAVENGYRWQGQLGIQQDAESSLYYIRSRWFEAKSRRLLSRDPLVATRPREVGTYSFALANPSQFVDPTGLRSQESLQTRRDRVRAAIKDAARETLVDTLVFTLLSNSLGGYGRATDLAGGFMFWRKGDEFDPFETTENFAWLGELRAAAAADPAVAVRIRDELDDLESSADRSAVRALEDQQRLEQRLRRLDRLLVATADEGQSAAASDSMPGHGSLASRRESVSDKLLWDDGANYLGIELPNGDTLHLRVPESGLDE